MDPPPLTVTGEHGGGSISLSVKPCFVNHTVGGSGSWVIGRRHQTPVGDPLHMSYLRGHSAMDDPDRVTPQPDNANRLIDYARALFADPSVNAGIGPDMPAWVPEWDPANMGPPLAVHDPFLWHGDPDNYHDRPDWLNAPVAVPALSR